MTVACVWVFPRLVTPSVAGKKWHHIYLRAVNVPSGLTSTVPSSHTDSLQLENTEATVALFPLNFSNL
jgi:hypothetical protein